jgi:hypothetical protein
MSLDPIGSIDSNDARILVLAGRPSISSRPPISIQDQEDSAISESPLQRVNFLVTGFAT